LDQLRQALERERFFTSDVSHELRTPLTVIATSCELLQAADTLNPKQKGQLQRVQRASQEMRELIHTFLQLARDNLDNESEAEQSYYWQYGAGTIRAMESDRRSKGLQLLLSKSIVIESRPAAAITILRYCWAVVSNLLRNAVHYTDSGYVRLVLTNTGFKVEDSGVALRRRNGRVFFSRLCVVRVHVVKDWGWDCRWSSASVSIRAGAFSYIVCQRVGTALKCP
jgi:signal transduction histidine kinase